MSADSPRSPRLRPGLAAFALVGLSAVTALLLFLSLEYLAGFFVEPLKVREIEGDSVSRTVTYIEVSPAPLVRDVDLLWRNEPGAHKSQPVNPQAFGRYDTWTIENNSEGFRGAERTRTPNPAEVLRVLCVGDSVTFGFSVDQGDSYPEQLLRVLQDRYPGRRFEVINAGVPGWSWMQGLRFLDLNLAALDPDAVVIGHGTNDQLFPAKVTDEERFLRLASPLARLKQQLAVGAAESNIYRAITRGLPVSDVEQPTPGCSYQVAREGACRRVSVEQIAAAVHEVAELAASRGVDLLVVNTDFLQTAAIRGVRQTVSRESLPFIDPVDEFLVRRRADEDARAIRLGLAPAVEPAPQLDAAPRRVVLRVVAPDKSKTFRVAGQGYFRPDFAFKEQLHDDGRDGDERAGDGVFSVAIAVPPEYGKIQYQYVMDEALEYAPVPPLSSSMGDRVLTVPGDRMGPVDVFGQGLLMVERVHPNRDGHRVIAEMVADRLVQFSRIRELVTQGGAPPP